MARSSRVTAATKRAKQMMVGGLVLAHVAGFTCLGIATVTHGVDGAFTVVISFAAVVLFFSIGQALEIIACELEPLHGMALALVSYAVRVIGITAALWAIFSLPAVEARIIDGWLVGAMTAGVFGWMAGVVLVASRQRVPIYDAEYTPPSK